MLQQYLIFCLPSSTEEEEEEEEKKLFAVIKNKMLEAAKKIKKLHNQLIMSFDRKTLIFFYFAIS